MYALTVMDLFPIRTRVVMQTQMNNVDRVILRSLADFLPRRQGFTNARPERPRRQAPTSTSASDPRSTAETPAGSSSQHRDAEGNADERLPASRT